jgi:predicted AAA+ superfamily ATPase
MIRSELDKQRGKKRRLRVPERESFITKTNKKKFFLLFCYRGEEKSSLKTALLSEIYARLTILIYVKRASEMME